MTEDKIKLVTNKKLLIKVLKEVAKYFVNIGLFFSFNVKKGNL